MNLPKKMIVALGLFSQLGLYAQNPNERRLLEDNTIYAATELDESLAFPGGLDALSTFLYSNIEYPKDAREQAVEGRVKVEFIVATDGSVYGAKILKGLGHGCDQEVLRVINKMPDWRPGRKNTLVVATRLVLSINFELTTS